MYNAEHLPSEDHLFTERAADNADSKTVRLTITTRILLSRALNHSYSLFGPFFGSGSDAYDDEDDFVPFAADDVDPSDLDDDDYYDSDDAESLEELPEELMQHMEEVIKRIAEDVERDDDTVVFRTIAQMRRTTDMCGNDVIEIEYREDESEMPDTTTIITYAPAQNDRVSVSRTGVAQTNLVCERGVRHISVYQTAPFIPPFECAICTKSCTSALTYEDGGFIELDYLNEFRGLDTRRTLLSIDVLCLE